MAAPAKPSTVSKFTYNPKEHTYPEGLKGGFIFSEEDIDGRIDSVTLETLEEGTTLYRLNRCKHILSEEGFKEIEGDKQCPCCRSPFETSKEYSEVNPKEYPKIEKVATPIKPFPKAPPHPFHQAILDDDYEGFTTIFFEREEWYILEFLKAEYDGMSSLHLAVRKDLFGEIAELIEQKFSKETLEELKQVKDSNGLTVEDLIKNRRKNIGEAFKTTGIIPLRKGNLQIHEALLKNNPLKEKIIEISDIQKKHTDKIPFLLALRNDDGFTPLHLALKAKNNNMFGFLFGMVDENYKEKLMSVKDYNGKTGDDYIKELAKSGKEEEDDDIIDMPKSFDPKKAGISDKTVSYPIEVTIDMPKPFDPKKTGLSFEKKSFPMSLHQAVKTKDPENLRKAFLAMPTRRDIKKSLVTKNKDGDTALHLAMKMKAQEVIDCLLDTADSPDDLLGIKNLAGKTPIECM